MDARKKNPRISSINFSISGSANELDHITKEMYKKNKDLAEKNDALALLRKIDEIVLSKVTDIKQIAQQVADVIVQELAFKAVVIYLQDKKSNKLLRLAVSETDLIKQTEKTLNKIFFNTEISISEDENLIVRSVKTANMQITHGLKNLLTPYLTSEETNLAEKTVGVTTTFIYPLVVREEVIGAMAVSVNDKEGFSGFKNELIDRLAGVIGIAIDNSLLYQRLQEANLRLKEVDKLKDEFVSLASHELRTPMTVIKSYLWLMLDKNNVSSLSEKQKMYIDRAYTSTQRLINLVNDMLNVSRIESGRFTLSLEPIDIVGLVSTVQGEMLPKAQEQKLSLEFVKPAASLPQVQADSERVEQVLINLIGNSLKYTKPGGAIKIQIVHNPSEKTETVSVSDNGKGISREDMPKLFKKFSMLGDNYLVKQTTQGTGLGLYLSKSIIELMGGKIWAESEGEGKGSKFSFTLKTIEGKI